MTASATTIAIKSMPKDGAKYCLPQAAIASALGSTNIVANKHNTNAATALCTLSNLISFGCSTLSSMSASREIASKALPRRQSSRGAGGLSACFIDEPQRGVNGVGAES